MRRQRLLRLLIGRLRVRVPPRLRGLVAQLAEQHVPSPTSISGTPHYSRPPRRRAVPLVRRPVRTDTDTVLEMRPGVGGGYTDRRSRGFDPPARRCRHPSDPNSGAPDHGRSSDCLARTGSPVRSSTPLESESPILGWCSSAINKVRRIRLHATVAITPGAQETVTSGIQSGSTPVRIRRIRLARESRLPLPNCSRAL